MTQLIPCPTCHRHIRQTEVACPFCDAALSLGDVPPPLLPRARLGRAATFAFGASVVSATTFVGCGDDVTVAPPYGGVPVAGSAGSAIYGGPPVAGMGNGGSAGHGMGGSAGSASYGGPPVAGTGGVAGGSAGGTGGRAAGGEASGGASGEASGGASDAGGLTAIYGGPPAGAGGQ